MQHFHDLIIARPWVLAFWIFVVGGAVGSFLNVVVYRLPRGMSLSRPGSHCPKCGHAIRWYHNLPIAGWLLLRGKCYDCKAPISPRYPLVELAVAVLFVAAAYFDVYQPSQHTCPAARLTTRRGARNLAFACWRWERIAGSGVRSWRRR